MSLDKILKPIKAGFALGLVTLAGLFSSCSVHDLRLNPKTDEYCVYKEGERFSYAKKIEEALKKAEKETNFGYKILTLEAELLPEKYKKHHKKAKTTLDEIIAESKKTIKVKANYSEDEAKKLLKSVGDIVDNKTKEHKARYYLTEGLAEGGLDCDTLVFTYLSVFDALGLSEKVSPVVTTGLDNICHVFLRYKLKSGKTFDWETTKKIKLPNGSVKSYKRAKEFEHSFRPLIYAIDVGGPICHEFFPSLTKKQLLAVHLETLGLAHFKDPYKLIEHCNASLRLFSNNSGAYQLRALAFCNLKLHEKAINDMNKAIKINEEFNLASVKKNGIKDLLGCHKYSLRADIHSKMGNYDKAEKDFAKAIELNPNHYQIYTGRGEHFYRLGKEKEALEDFNKAIKLNPKAANAYFERGSFLNKIDKFEESLKDLKKAKELGYSNFEILDYYIKDSEEEIE